MKSFAAVVTATVFLGLAGCSGSTGGGGASAQGSEYDQNLASGFEMLRQQRYADARAVFMDMAGKYPEDGTVALALGVSHHELGEWDAAEAQYQKALRTGKDTSVKETIEDGTSKSESTTIGKLAELNLEKLSQDRPK